MLIGLVSIPAAIFVVVWQRSEPAAATLLMVVLAFVAMGWLVLTIVGGGGESLLDPTLFSIYPISERKLVAGFLAAAFVGVPAMLTAAAALATVSHASSLAGGVVVGLAAIVFTVSSVLTGRVGITSMSGMLRGRRTRELATWAAVILGSSVGLIGPIAGEFDFLSFDGSTMEPVRRIVRFLPWGWAPESIALAIEGRIGLALVFLVLAIGFAGGLARTWVLLLQRIMTSRGVAPQVEISDRLIPRWMQPFGSSPTVAVWARSLRQLRRDPRELLEVAAFMPAVVIFAVPGLEALRDGDERAVLSSASIGLAVGITSLNMFGADGRSFGVDALASRTLREVLIGKALARMSLGVPLVLLVATIMCAVSGSWRFLVPALAIALTALGAMSGVGIYVSARSPFPLPEKVTMGGGQNQGCVSAIVRVVAMFVAMLVAAPGVGVTTAVSLLVGPLVGSFVGIASVVYGFAIFWWSAGTTGTWADRHVPEMFQELAAAS